MAPIYQTSEYMVKQFHRALDHPIGDKPAQISDERLLLRLRLIAEEVAELFCAMTGNMDLEQTTKDLIFPIVHALYSRKQEEQRESDLVEVADGCCDAHYVISGTAIEFGIPEDEVYVEVQRSNMAKVGGPKRADGKTLRPAGWTPPDIEPILRAAGWEG